MRRLSVFNHVSLDGFFTDRRGSLDWAHEGTDDPEFNRFVAGNASGKGELLFGKTTYDMMVKWWPTPAAAEAMPVVAAGMNASPKIVFSRKLKSASWQNTRVLEGDLPKVVRKLKSLRGPGMVILGSGSIVAQLANAGVIDEFQLVVNPVVLGEGRSMFEGARDFGLVLTESRAFGNGKVFLRYVVRGAKAARGRRNG